jgi:hypothetical protein
MARLIFFSQYTNNKTHQVNYIDYISLKACNDSKSLGVTTKQEKLIDVMMSSKHNQVQFTGFESYREYLENPTKMNASRFLTEALQFTAIEQLDTKAYLEYIANRMGSRGLFNHLGDLAYEEEAQKVADFSGNVYMHVFSLKKQDALALGYDNPEKWRETLINKIPEIAQQMKIPLHRLEWNAAFHQSATHPHVHVMMWDTENKAFQNAHSLEKIRSIMTNEIFTEEMQSIKEELSIKKSEFYMQAQKKIEETFLHDTSNIFNKQIKALSLALEAAKGKKVYGYLSGQLKQQVNELVRYILQDEQTQGDLNQYLEKYQDAVAMYNVNPEKILQRVEEYRNEIVQPQKKNTNKSLHNLIIKLVLEKPEVMIQVIESKQGQSYEDVEAISIDVYKSLSEEMESDVAYDALARYVEDNISVNYDDLMDDGQMIVQELSQEVSSHIEQVMEHDFFDVENEQAFNDFATQYHDQYMTEFMDGEYGAFLHDEIVQGVNIMNEQQKEINKAKQIHLLKKVFEQKGAIDITLGIKSEDTKNVKQVKLIDNLRIVLKAGVIAELDDAKLTEIVTTMFQSLDIDVFSKIEQDAMLQQVAHEATNEVALKEKYGQPLQLTQREQKHFTKMTGTKQRPLPKLSHNKAHYAKFMSGLVKTMLYEVIKNRGAQHGKTSGQNRQQKKNNLGLDRDWELEL